MAKLLKLKALTPEQVQDKITMLKENIAKLHLPDGSVMPGLDTIVSEFQNELASFEAMLTSANVVNKADEFSKLFASLEASNIDADGNVTALSDEQVKWLGEGITVKLTADGKLAYVKKAGGGTGSGGPKAPTAYIDFLIPFDNNGVTEYAHFAKASAAVGKVAAGEAPHEHSVLSLLKSKGIEHKLAPSDSMVREIERLNGQYKLGIRVTINPERSAELGGQTIDLADSPLLSAKAPKAEADETDADSESEAGE